MPDRLRACGLFDGIDPVQLGVVPHGLVINWLDVYYILATVSIW